MLPLGRSLIRRSINRLRCPQMPLKKCLTMPPGYVKHTFADCRERYATKGAVVLDERDSTGHTVFARRIFSSICFFLCIFGFLCINYS